MVKEARREHHEGLSARRRRRRGSCLVSSRFSRAGHIVLGARRGPVCSAWGPKVLRRPQIPKQPSSLFGPFGSVDAEPCSGATGHHRASKVKRGAHLQPQFSIQHNTLLPSPTLQAFWAGARAQAPRAVHAVCVDTLPNHDRPRAQSHSVSPPQPIALHQTQPAGGGWSERAGAHTSTSQSCQQSWPAGPTHNFGNPQPLRLYSSTSWTSSRRATDN